MSFVELNSIVTKTQCPPYANDLSRMGKYEHADEVSSPQFRFGPSWEMMAARLGIPLILVTTNIDWCLQGEQKIIIRSAVWHFIREWVDAF